MYPDRDTLNNVSRSGYIATRDQSRVESGVTEGGKNTASFLFREWQNNTNTEAQAKKQRLLKVTQGEKLQLVEEKDASAFKIVNHSFSGLRIKFVLL